MRLLVWILRRLFPAGRRRASRTGSGGRRLPGRPLLAGGVLLLLLAAGTAGLAGRAVPALPAGAHAVLARPPTPSLPLLRPLAGREKPAGAELTERLYVPVAPAAAGPRAVSAAELRARWRQVARLVITEEAAQALATRWGPVGEGVIVVADALAVSRQLLDMPQAIGVVAFDELSPAVRALPLGGVDLLDRTVPNRLWPLRARWEVRAGQAVPPSNRDPEGIGVLVLTGVTAPAEGEPGPARASAARIALFARSADVWHASVRALGGGCAPGELPGCGGPVLRVLLDVGADVVEFSGLHPGSRQEIAAWQEALATLGVGSFGAGRNAAEAARPYTVDVRGTRVTFLGYAAGSRETTATPDEPGTNAYDPVRLRADIVRARQAGADLVFVHIDYGEVYHATPTADQRATFQTAVEAGADLVVGTQPFVPQAFELHQGRPIFYGLGPFLVPENGAYGPRGLVLQALVHRGKLLQVRPLVVAAGPEPRLLPAEESTPFLATLAGWSD